MARLVIAGVALVATLLSVGADGTVGRADAALARTITAAPLRVGSPSRPRLFFVSTGGSDSNGDGSRVRPWRTIARACESTPGGVGNTIRVEPGSYFEATTCSLPCKTHLRGAGAQKTRVAGEADSLITVHNCMNRANTQIVDGMHLDGHDRSEGTFGLRAIRTRGLKITRMIVEGFKGPEDAGGGAIDIDAAWDLDLGHSVLRDSGHAGTHACSGTLGLGNLHDSKIHDLVIAEDRGYGVKSSTNGVPGPSHMRDVEFFNLSVRTMSDVCADWSTLAFELWETDAVRTTIRNSLFNRPVSLTDIDRGKPLKTGYRYRIHNNLFSIVSDNDYAIELDQDSSIVDHNYVVGGLYPIANFTPDRKRRISIHHNVFDNQTGPTAGVHLTAGVQDATFYNNTVVLRQPSLRDGVFSLSERGFADSTINIRNNVFINPYFWMGDELGSGLSSAHIDHNEFFNLAAKGSGAVVGNALLPLSGGFPSAYVPQPNSPAIDAGVVIPGITTGYAGAAPDLGAFDRGARLWSVGPKP